ncbi:MAG: iron chelate uptake ABC transporter family permease subunit, partial [Atopobiaceae bacterium]
MAKKNMTREHPAQQEPAEDNLTRKGPGAPGRGGRGGARLGAALSLGVVVLVVLSLASLAVGNSSISTTDALSALVGTSSNGTASLIVWGVRVPRTLAALTCGAALAGSGLLLQSSLDNDLAAPSIMGVN